MSSACASFRGQLWRPAHCVQCHLALDAHDALWVEDRDAVSGRALYRHAVSGEVVFARCVEGAEVDALVARLREAAAAAARAAAAPAPSGLVASQVELWSARQAELLRGGGALDGASAAPRSGGSGGEELLGGGGGTAAGLAASELLPLEGVAATPAALPLHCTTSLPPPPLPAAAVLPHLETLHGDPLELDLRALTGSPHWRSDASGFGCSGGATGVLPFPVRQAYDETFAAPRYLVISPTTVAGVAPHPTRLGFGILKWERSLLSLVSIVAQPLFRPLAPSRGSGVSAAVGAGRLLEADAVALVDAADCAAGARSTVVESLPFDIGRPADPKPRSSSSSSSGFWLGKLFRGGGATSSVRGDGATGSGAQPGGEGGGAFLMYGTGLLLSFAPEVPETLALLRTVRAGCRPVRRSGWLLKRKRAEWREFAPLGPLAWKRRWFVLEPTLLTYYQQSHDGCAAKGAIPFAGWVEVARVGGPSRAHDATTHAHAFIVRTGTTSHAFQAHSAEDADAWVAAIAINAQHAGVAQDDPQCVITRSHGEADVLATALRARREELCARAGGAGAPIASAAVTAWAQRGRCNGGARGNSGACSVSGEGRVPALEVDLSASAIMADAARSRARGPDPSPPMPLATAGYYRGDASIGSDRSNGSSSACSLQEASALAAALGGVTAELLLQLPPPVARELARINGVAMPTAPPPGGEPPPRAEWRYLDDAAEPRGPFSTPQMRAWLEAGYFTASTRVRSDAPLPPREREAVAAIAAQPGGPWIDAVTGAAARFVPLVSLFERPESAFAPPPPTRAHHLLQQRLPSTGWPARYAAAAGFSALLEWACGAGLGERAALQRACDGMAAASAPPDPGLLLDLLERSAQ